MNRVSTYLTKIAGLSLIITATFLMVTSCEDNSPSPEPKVFMIWTMSSQDGNGTLYQNYPETFEGSGRDLSGLSADIKAMFLTNGGGKLWSVGVAAGFSKKILTIDQKTAAVTEKDLTSGMLNTEPGGIAWGNGKLWCIYQYFGGFITCTLDPDTLEETVQTQFIYGYDPYSTLICGIDTDETNNLLWVGVAMKLWFGLGYYLQYDAYDLTSGGLVSSVVPTTLYYTTWASDIEVGENYIWSTNWDDDGNTVILKTDKQTYVVQAIYSTEAGDMGIAF
jgi:hypothetical protein